MQSNRFLKPIFLMVIAIASMHIIAIIFHLYWSLWWFDKVTHFFWGFWVAMVFLSFSIFKNYINQSNKSYRRFLLISVVFSLVIGVFWEIFEFQAGVTSLQSSNFVFDTASDLLMDILGSIAGSMYVFSRYKIFNNSKTNE